MKPVIIVPGLYASIPNPLAKNGYSLGFSERFYGPLIDGLTSMGYVMDKDLFVACYPWWENIRFISSKFLVPMIDTAKNACKCDDVILICHSMGGLVARDYIQDNGYRNDVDKLIMLGTPNAGSANAYYAWEGGDLAPTPDFDPLNIFYKAFVWMISRQHLLPHPKDVIRNHIKSIKELMPVREYGNYIFTYKNGEIDFIPIREMKEKNDYLAELNKRFDILEERCRLYLFGGTGHYTNEYIQVSSKKDKCWEDGKPEGVVRNLEGDGTVLLKSLRVKSNAIEVKSLHTDLMGKALEQISKILNINYKGHFETEKIDNYLSIIVPKGVDLYEDVEDLKFSKVTIYDRFDWYLMFNVKKRDYRFRIRENLPVSDIFIDTMKNGVNVYKEYRRTTSEFVIKGEDIN
ncbi:lipase family alpha/beta hydrolase [Calorimonas adulescens]|nr:lecithin--cholesterol acyltransferase [Calorimonas adulescens]